jgi:hypothetical protein
MNIKSRLKRRARRVCIVQIPQINKAITIIWRWRKEMEVRVD